VPLLVGNYVLGGGGFNSRLYYEVREKRGLSYSVYSSLTPYAEAGAFQIGLQTRKDQAGQALEVVRTTLREFIEQGPTEAELEGAKQNLIGGFPLRLDSNKKILDYLAVIGFYRLPLDYLETFPRKVEAVTVEQIREAFRRRIDPDRLVTVVVGASD
jgi:zinc protease